MRDGILRLMIYRRVQLLIHIVYTRSSQRWAPNCISIMHLSMPRAWFFYSLCLSTRSKGICRIFIELVLWNYCPGLPGYNHANLIFLIFLLAYRFLMKNDIPHLHSSPKFLLKQSSSPKFQINVQRILTCLIHIHARFLESLSNGFPLSSTLQAE